MNPSLWVTEVPAFPGSLLPVPTQTEVVIIGGGIAGVSAALHLARAGIEVVLLEADEIGGRATGRSDGQLLLGIGEHYNRVVSQFGADRARDLWSFIRENNTRLKQEITNDIPDCHLGESGGLRLAETEAEFSEILETSKLLDEENIPHTVLISNDLTKLLPVKGFVGALKIPGEATVQPVSMVCGLARLAHKAGAKIYTHHKVFKVQSSDGDHIVYLPNGDQIKTLTVVHCTSALALYLDRTGFLQSQIFPYRGQIMATDPLNDWQIEPFQGLAMSSNFCYEYFRTHQQRFTIGGMRWSVKGQEEHTIDDSVINPVINQNLQDYVDNHFPSLRGVEFPYTWTGIMAGTNDGLPLVGPMPGRVGTLISLAFNGYGLSFAYKAGELIKDYIVNGKPNHPAAGMLSLRRFT
jgi:gamma-glutamylputrescine oxidase